MSAPSDETALPKVLVIDGNVFFVKRLTDALKREGFEVVHTTNAAYALTMLEYAPPVAILCATSLRDIRAYDLPRLVHADGGTAHIPILMMGEDDRQALMDAFRAGCDDYIDRRLGPENVAAQVRVFLRSRDEGFQPTQMLDTTQTTLEGSLSHLDLPGIIQMLGHSRQSGALHINAGSIDGLIFFDEGEVHHAEAGDKVGDEAVVSIIKACNGIDHGVYKFVAGARATTRTVLRSVTELMLGALREIDEEREGQHKGGLA